MEMKGIIKGIGIGMAVGGASAYVRGMMRGSGMKKIAKKKINGAMKLADGLIGDMKYMFR